MYYLVMLVIDDLNQEMDIFDAWEDAGVGGITIIDSTGLARVRHKESLRGDFPLMPSLRSFFQSREEHHRTIFSIVEGEEMIEKLLQATESVTGKLSQPQTGIMFAMPLSFVAGVPRRNSPDKDDPNAEK
ncbi:MAG: hypothetical protein KJ046_02855 [Anaerolineae bacterium]|nr:hypothetical protein [Anaerolineae bacterium]RIK23466.1 MAG: hypothetical protein DCC51_03570 [Anaerolineae bacterium]